MKKALISLFLGVAITAFAADAPPIPVVPDAFLRTDITAWKRILAKPVKADFRQARLHLHDAIGFLFRGSDGNYIVQNEAVSSGAPPPSTSSAIDAPDPEPIVSCNIPKVPLRTALFIIAKESGAKVTWDMKDGFPHAIKVSYK